ncbi:MULTISPECIES: hypothetical protein [unclassified Methylobacterium]|uniref:hypothetical protein n=1 Tax=unclassified Methylobacterium TaxID=2615210 RepID=UPI0011C1EF13|nr:MULTISPECIES: hypothetical protein [unclassified Methylobacterium]MCJ2096691.1 hypothetical protein [Methylobacterium sp. J-072]MCJ2118403.1 hypothetical protein [Methylobacterium sp. J-001]QEE41577.1 hypothetical protein FVA80_24160 [Methylobacterium sp. WL1]TXN52614.1 hypothetical protein FV241_29185 [Methylobacterium sp. WL2]
MMNFAMTHSAKKDTASSRGIPAAQPQAADELIPLGSAFTFAQRLSRRFDGARLITMLGSDLVVGVAPIDEVHILFQETALTSYAAYIALSRAQDGYCIAVHEPDAEAEHVVAGDGDCASGEAKVGETIKVPRRWQEHLRLPPLRIERLFIIGSTHKARIGKDAILALQALLTRQIQRAGHCSVVGASPQEAMLEQTDPGLGARWLADARQLLVGAGCLALEPRGTWLRPAIQIAPRERAGSDPDTPIAVPPLTGLKRGYRLDVPLPVFGLPEVRRYTLAWREVRATAVSVPGCTILEAGSTLAAEDGSSIQPGVANKRRQLVAAGAAYLGEDGLLHLRVPVVIPSLTNGGRLATATNVPGRVWSAR